MTPRRPSQFFLFGVVERAYIAAATRFMQKFIALLDSSDNLGTTSTFLG